MAVGNQDLQLPWVEKYRPVNLEAVVSNETTIKTIRRFVDSGRIPHMLLHGPPGTGKTSTILALAKELYSDSKSGAVLQFNASDDRGINVIREDIKPFAQCRTQLAEGLPKLVILDEADQMTQPAQNALRRIMEEFAANVRFCLVCNYVSKIHEAIKSRCTRFKFHPLRDDDAVTTVQWVCQEEKVDLSKEGLQALLYTGKGDMRRILNALQCTHMAYPMETLTADHILRTLGLPLQVDTQACLKMLLDSDVSVAADFLSDLLREKGYSLTNIVCSLEELVWSLDLPETSLIQLIIRLADIERRLSIGASEDLEIGALVGSFVEANLENLNVYNSQ